MAIKSKGKQFKPVTLSSDDRISTTEGNRANNKKISPIFQQAAYPNSKAQGNRTLNKTKKYNL